MLSQVADELRHQEYSRRLWQDKEGHLAARVTFLENIIRRANEVPPQDVLAGERVSSMRTSGRDSGGQHALGQNFATTYHGPVVTEEHGAIYLDASKMNHQLKLDAEHRDRAIRWQYDNPITMTLAGNSFHYVQKPT
mmetsp:Transcript_48135/g.127456  ORF Transcript_48135/g.127456 Transcript_48135/m.127456 type:complete len:137 (-) Transcript_48135:68-478(-)